MKAYVVKNLIDAKSVLCETEGEAQGAAMEYVSQLMRRKDVGDISGQVTVEKLMYVSMLVNNAYRMLRPEGNAATGREIPTGSMKVENLTEEGTTNV